MNFLQPLSAQAQHARKIYTSAASKHDVSTLFGIDYRLWLHSRDVYYIDDFSNAAVACGTSIARPVQHSKLNAACPISMP